ncbi:MAG TPA: hypothetical protein PKB05_04090 [Oligoflexia bacterium]|nr:hypothetical protein [Oligoflexia bacterium]
MNILILLIAIGIAIILLAAYFFVFTVKNAEYEHMDDSVWLPFDDEESEIKREQ